MYQTTFCACVNQFLRKTFSSGSHVSLRALTSKQYERCFTSITSCVPNMILSRTISSRLFRTHSNRNYENVRKFLPRVLFSRTATWATPRVKNIFINTHLDRISSSHRLLQRRYINTPVLSFQHRTVLLYLTSAAVLAVGLSYAAVPLYRLYCQASGYGGTTKKAVDVGDKIMEMKRVEDRMITIRFEAGTNKTLQWKFKPQQKEVKLVPGETALAFYTAENLTDRPIIGIATYNVVPFDAGQYFNKIQCFCFEEQQLNPHEEVDMPVFFYIDPEFVEDPKMAKYDEIILSYVFFESKDNESPIPRPHGVS